MRRRLLALGLTSALACALGCNRGPDARLGQLQAAAEKGQVAQAEALAASLAGTPTEPAALALLAELYVKARDPQAAAHLQKLGQKLQQGGHHAQAAVVARQQGRLAWADSRYLDAIEAFDRQARLARQAGDRTLETKGQLGLFTMLYEVGDLRGGQAALKDAAAGAGLDPELRMMVAFNQGLLAAAEEQVQSASSAFKEVLRSPVVKPGSEMAWNANVNLLAMALDAGEVALATDTSRAVEALFAGGFKERSSSRIARGLYRAQLERLRGQPAAGLALLDALAPEKPSPQWRWKIALERGRALRALGQSDAAQVALEESAATVEALRSDQYDDFKSWVLAQRRAPFEALFELHLGRKDLAAALQIHERLQGRTFIEAFATNLRPAAGSPANVSETPRRIESLRKLYPALRASAVVAAPLPAPELRARLADSETLAYFETRERLYVLHMQKGAIAITPAAAPLATVRQLVARVQAAPDDGPAAEQLGALLLPATLRARDDDSRPLHISPSPLLGRLPFAALRRQGRALIEDRVLAQVPSLNALVALRGHAPAAPQPPVILANAARDLPEAEREAQAVAASLDSTLGQPSRLFLGPQATAQQLQQARGARVLHLAVHSGVGPTGPFIGLADRPLLASELLDWRLGAELVVLASCASAATPDPGLWGSLVASFLASGSPAVVGALWSTQDLVSRQLVERFYAEDGARDPAGALARAQRAWRAEHRPTSDWAAFVFYGAAKTPEPRRTASRTTTTRTGSR